MTTISIRDKALTSKLCIIALTLGITPDAVATGILYAHCMSEKEKKKAPATTATTATTATAQPEVEEEKPRVIDGLAALASLRKELKQS